MITIAVLGTLDTKGCEHEYVAQRIRLLGVDTLLVDVGTGSTPSVQPDITRDQIVGSPELLATLDRGSAIDSITRSAPAAIKQLVAEGRLQGIISMGGSGGTAIATAIMRALPLGLPKVMVSTMASGNVSRYVDISDIVMMPSIVDVSGLNRITRAVFDRAASAVVAMAKANASQPAGTSDKPIIVASMFGNTTQCVDKAKAILEQAGYEVLVFHATGVGGRTMEALIESGEVTGVLDLTTTEWADEFVGGVLPGGPTRLEAAARHGVPAVIAPGCLDMVNFGPRDTVPAQFAGRVFYQHNPQVTLMRTTPDECRVLGRIIAERLNLSCGPVEILFPTQAISVISAAGQPFHDPAADRALLESLRQYLSPAIKLSEIDAKINDPVFASAAAKSLLELINLSSSPTR